mmetsp:Transcript_4984/g.12891  ORF Transcript_4984/g.12891 Transcript_4984/m.12891 type:complete len:273 (-) Transcript_4984:1868-2686(-)
MAQWVSSQGEWDTSYSVLHSSRARGGCWRSLPRSLALVTERGLAHVGQTRAARAVGRAPARAIGVRALARVGGPRGTITAVRHPVCVAARLQLSAALPRPRVLLARPREPEPDKVAPSTHAEHELILLGSLDRDKPRAAPDAVGVRLVKGERQLVEQHVLLARETHPRPAAAVTVRVQTIDRGAAHALRPAAHRAHARHGHHRAHGREREQHGPRGAPQPRACERAFRERLERAQRRRHGRRRAAAADGHGHLTVRGAAADAAIARRCREGR